MFLTLTRNGIRRNILTTDARHSALTGDVIMRVVGVLIFLPLATEAVRLRIIQQTAHTSRSV